MNAPTLKLTVTTVPAASAGKGFLQITANTRATKVDGVKKEIPADQRSRSIIIPEFAPNVSSKYVGIVVSALREVAKEQLAQQWKAEPMIREVDAVLYTEDSLLLFAAREAESKRLSAVSILAWYEQSALKKYIDGQKYNEKSLAAFLASLENLAANVLSPKHYNEEKALKRIALLGKFEEDTEHEVCKALIAKLASYCEDIKAGREEIGDVTEIA